MLEIKIGFLKSRLAHYRKLEESSPTSSKNQIGKISVKLTLAHFSLSMIDGKRINLSNVHAVYRDMSSDKQ
tara:strand:+ start:67 stop:279 length:213 start_codon:yes stop_codon:yes gene_type:complete